VKTDAGGVISPDVLSANIDDVVAWTFDKRKQNDVFMLSTTSNNNNNNNNKTGKRAPKNVHIVSEGCELDAEKMAGQVMRPRSDFLRLFRLSEFPNVVSIPYHIVKLTMAPRIRSSGSPIIYNRRTSNKNIKI